MVSYFWSYLVTGFTCTPTMHNRKIHDNNSQATRSSRIKTSLPHANKHNSTRLIHGISIYGARTKHSNRRLFSTNFIRRTHFRQQTGRTIRPHNANILHMFSSHIISQDISGRLLPRTLLTNQNRLHRNSRRKPHTILTNGPFRNMFRRLSHSNHVSITRVSIRAQRRNRHLLRNIKGIIRFRIRRGPITPTLSFTRSNETFNVRGLRTSLRRQFTLLIPRRIRRLRDIFHQLRITNSGCIILRRVQFWLCSAVPVVSLDHSVPDHSVSTNETSAVSFRT